MSSANRGVECSLSESTRGKHIKCNGKVFNVMRKLGERGVVPLGSHSAFARLPYYSDSKERGLVFNDFVRLVPHDGGGVTQLSKRRC